MRAVISVLFGARDHRVGWVSEEDVPKLPTIGMPVMIRLGVPDVEPLEGQVYRAWPDSNNEPGGMLIYGGPSIPNETFQEGIESVGWHRLTDDALKVLSEAVDETPVLAATHEVVLVVGDPEKQEELQVYQRSLTPYDPTLPLFSQRMRLEISNDLTEAQVEETRIIEDSEDEDEDSDITIEEWYAFREEQMMSIDAELVGAKEIDGVLEGVPAVAIYSALVKTGVARIAFWSPGIGNIEPEQLIANTWRALSIPEEFNPVEFRLEERVNLAMQSSVTFEPTEYGTTRIKDWIISSPLDITDDQFDLLPPLLIEFIRAERDFADVDSFLDEWEKD